jgi:hypothetical protein
LLKFCRDFITAHMRPPRQAQHRLATVPSVMAGWLDYAKVIVCLIFCLSVEFLGLRSALGFYIKLRSKAHHRPTKAMAKDPGITTARR